MGFPGFVITSTSRRVPSFVRTTLEGGFSFGFRWPPMFPTQGFTRFFFLIFLIFLMNGANEVFPYLKRSPKTYVHHKQQLLWSALLLRFFLRPKAIRNRLAHGLEQG